MPDVRSGWTTSRCSPSGPAAVKVIRKRQHVLPLSGRSDSDIGVVAIACKSAHAYAVSRMDARNEDKYNKG